MSRNEEFFHGTTAHLYPGDTVEPAGGPAVFPHTTDHRFAYATRNPDDAWWYAEKAYNATDSGIPRVYRVSPLGRHSKDPERDREGLSRGNFEGDRRSLHGWEVVDEVPMPENMGPPEEWR